MIVGKTFKFNLASLGFFFAVLILLISLGFWQLGRAEEKKIFLEQQFLAIDKQEVDVVLLTDEDPKDLRYRNTTVTGRYDQEHQYLIDNQMVNGQVGYFVMTPFILKGLKKAVLINRGWVPLNKNRQILPEIKINTKKNIVKGRINNFPVVGIKLAGAEIPTKNWPSTVQVVDSKVLSEKLGYDLFPFQVELDSAAKEGYVRNWRESTVISPEKHIAYAVQWFGLAITLTILFISFNRKNK